MLQSLLTKKIYVPHPLPISMMKKGAFWFARELVIDMEGGEGGGFICHSSLSKIVGSQVLVVYIMWQSDQTCLLFC